MLESMTRETFENCPHKGFKLKIEAGELELELKQTVELGRRSEGMKRKPFSVTFEGPSEPVLPQRIYTLENAELGVFELFLVPVASDDNGTSYEAVFT